MTDEDLEEYECQICQIDHRVVDHPFAQCTNSGQNLGNGPHRFCLDMFCRYALAECDPGGAYCGVRVRGGLRSESGHLPCPVFMGDECECVSIPEVSILNALAVQGRSQKGENSQDLRRFLQIRDRIRLDQLVAEEKNEEERQQQVLDNQTRLDSLLSVVQETLSVGGAIRCPRCRVLCQKNDACIHMICSQCHESFCYCCGRKKRTANAEGLEQELGNNDCTSCGNHLFIEEQDGWGQFAINGENAARGALNEFHRRRMAYFLKLIKQETMAASPDLWARFQVVHHDILENIPTPGRRIEWESIDSSTPPLFGTTQETDLVWAEEGRKVLDDLRKKFEDETMEATILEPTLNDVDETTGNTHREPQDFFRSCSSSKRNSDLLCYTIAASAVTGICITLLATADKRGLTLLFIGISGVVAIVMTLVMESAVDTLARMRLEQTASTTFFFSNIREVQLFGAPINDLLNPRSSSLVDEDGQLISQYSVPFLSHPNGRWKNFRRAYFSAFFLFLGLGSVLVNTSTRPHLTSLGWFLILSSLLFYSTLSVIVNIEAPPLRTPLNSEQRDQDDEGEEGLHSDHHEDGTQIEESRFNVYRIIVGRIGCFIFLLIVGICLQTSSSLSKPKLKAAANASALLILISIGAIIAELLPRLARQGQQPRVFSEPIEFWPLAFSHGAFFCLTTGYGLILAWSHTNNRSNVEGWGFVAIGSFIFGLLGVYTLMEWFVLKYQARFSTTCRGSTLSNGTYVIVWIGTLIAGSVLVGTTDSRVYGLGVATLVFLFAFLTAIAVLARVELQPALPLHLGPADRNRESVERRYTRLKGSVLGCVVALAAGSGIQAGAASSQRGESQLEAVAAFLLILGFTGTLAVATPYVFAYHFDGLRDHLLSSAHVTHLNKMLSAIIWFAFGLGIFFVDQLHFLYVFGVILICLTSVAGICILCYKFNNA